LGSLYSNCIGIDLGTANTLVCTKEKGIIIREMSAVAFDNRNERIIAVGNEAKKLMGKTASNISVVRPLCGGVIADFELTLAMLRLFIKKAMKNSVFAKPKVIVCIPYGVSEVEHRALENAAFEAGADTYLTGTLSYNAMVDAAELPMNIIEAGHFHTENHVLYMLADLIEELDPDIETEIYESNPIRSI
jgi:actin-like ATPase involved in cell morphogenesis